MRFSTECFVTVRDYYHILNVAREASTSEIRRAYRRLALEYHPDHHPEDPEAEDKFKEISEAYSVLGDAQKRKAYDLLRNRESGSAQFWDDLSMNANSRFWRPGRGRGRARRASQYNMKAVLNIVQIGQTYEFLLTAEEAQLGTERIVLVESGTKRKGYRIQIPEGVSQGTQFKAILGRDQSRYIHVRISIIAP